MKLTARIAAPLDRSDAVRSEVAGVAAVPAFSRGFDGSGARSHRRVVHALLAALAVIVSLVFAAAPATASEMGSVTNVSYSSAHLTGTITSTGFTAYSFEYSTDESTWSSGPGGFVIGETGEIAKGVELENLKGGTQYFVRLSVNGVPTAGAPYPSFTTLSVDPPAALAIDNASDVSYTTATAKGEVSRPANADPAFNVDCHFQYVTDEQFQATGFSDSPGSVPCEGTNPIEAPGASEVEAHLTGLANDTTYHLRLVVSNASPTTDAKEAAQTFTTLKVDPPSVVSIDNASEIEYSRAQVKGVVERPNASTDPAFDITACSFEYVTDQQFNDNPPGEEFAGAGAAACEVELPIHAEGQADVEAHLTGLIPSTTYHLRLSASNQGGADAKQAAATFTTDGPAPIPTVTATDAPSDVTQNSAKFTGKVQRPAGADPALDINCHFEYISDSQFLANEDNAEPGFTGAQTVDCAENTITSEGETNVSANAGLTPNTTYHLRLVAENLVGGSDAKDAAATFTTPKADIPTVTIDPVPAGVFTKALITGTATFGNGHTIGGVPYIQISSDGGATWSIADRMYWNATGGPVKDRWQELFWDMYGEHEGLYLLKREITGLQPSTTYLVRIALSYRPLFNEFELPEAEANGEVGFSSEETITTEPSQSPPDARGLAITSITGTSAHLAGTVDPQAPGGPLSEAAKKAYETEWHFECTPECKDANGNTLGGVVQAEEGAQAVSGDVKRLDPNTEYEVRLVVNSEGGDDTESETFSTPLIKPTIKVSPGGSDGKGGYTLEGTVNPNASPVSDCKFEWGPNSADYAFTADCSPAPGDKAKPVTVEAHLTGLNPGVVYHYNLLATNAAGTAESGDQEFIPTLDPPESCLNEQLRRESRSLALPECRAYEQVTPAGKEGSRKTSLTGYSGSGDAVSYKSEAGNIAKSGQNQIGLNNFYVATRAATGWETIPNLNGASGTFRGAPTYFEPAGSLGVHDLRAYSPDLLSSLWVGRRKGDPVTWNYYLRSPDGTFALIGRGNAANLIALSPSAVSADLSHFVVQPIIGGNVSPTLWGPGVYEFVGTGVDVPRRVDVDNSGDPLTTCLAGTAGAAANAISTDGRAIVFSVPDGCGGGDSPANQIWARVNGTTSFNVSASQCTRVDCNAPSAATFAGAAEDGSRVFFTTRQQLLDADTDQTNDLYACDIPSGSPGPIGEANPCSALTEISGSGDEAKVDPPLYDENGMLEANPGVQHVSEDGSTVLFVAQGSLTSDEDAFGEKPVAGDHNLYVWRTDATHPTGQMLFVGRLDSNDVQGAQTTPDDRYLVFTTASQLVATDTDSARDVYRYDTDTGTLTRASTNAFGVAGNGEGLDAAVPRRGAVSDDGQKIAFSTSEALSSADGNGEPDVYLWTPARVSLISTGSVGSGAAFNEDGSDSIGISGSGRDIYFMTRGALTPADTDDLLDVYDARVGGGFSFAQKPVCNGESCQAPAAASPSTATSPANGPNGGGNVAPKTCPKGKVLKGNKCVKKKKHKKHAGKKHSGKKRGGKKAAHKQGGGK